MTTKQAIAHLPLNLELITRLNGNEHSLANVVVQVPILAENTYTGHLALALDTDELHALIRRAATALDSSTRDDN